MKALNYLVGFDAYLEKSIFYIDSLSSTLMLLPKILRHPLVEIFSNSSSRKYSSVGISSYLKDSASPLRKVFKILSSFTWMVLMIY
jgi:hypothetical protein